MQQTSMAGTQTAALRYRRAALDIVLIAAGSAVIALGAQVAIPLPYTAVPITLQTLAVLVVAAALGSRRGSAAVMAYLLEGAAGLPVFAGGSAGAVHLFGATGGYLWSFVAAAALVGWLAEGGWCRTVPRAVATMSAATAVILLGGTAWLAAMIGPTAAVSAGLIPFVPGAVVKIAMASAAGPTARRLLWRVGAACGNSRLGPE